MQWPGDWLACPNKGEVLLVLYARGDELVYVAAHCRSSQPRGWVPMAHIQPLSGCGYHEFSVGVTPEVVGTKPIGLACVKAEGAIPGLLVVDVQPNSLIDDWNATCRENFGRDQLLLGDIITRVNDCSRPDELMGVLRALGTGQHLQARVLRPALSIPCQADELQAVLLSRSRWHAGGGGATRDLPAGFGGCRAWYHSGEDPDEDKD